MGPALVPTAHAHPFGARFAAHRTEVHVRADVIAVTYTADVPLGIVKTATRTPGADPVAAMATELRNGILLQADGRTLRLEARGSPEVQATDDSMAITQHLVAATASGVRHVELSNANIPDVPAYFSLEAHVAPSLAVDDSSLFHFVGERLVRDDAGRWRLGDAHRTLTLDVASRPAGWQAWHWFAEGSFADRPAAAALAGSPGDVLLGHRSGPLILWLGLGATLLAGAAAGEASRSRLVLGWSVVGAAGAVVVAAAGPLPWLDLLAGAALLGAAIARLPVAHLAAACVAASCVGLHLPRLSGLLLAVWWVAAGVSAGRRLAARPQVVAALAVATGLWLTVRGLASVAI